VFQKSVLCQGTILVLPKALPIELGL